MSDSNHNSPRVGTASWGQREEIIERFERAWAAGGQPDLDEFLPAHPGERVPVLIELVHADLEYRIKAGMEVRAADYLARFPELGHDPRIIADLDARELTARKTATHKPAHAAETGPDVAAESVGDDRPARKAQGASGPQQLGPYRLLERLGAGGMGVVYLAEDSTLRRQLALKVMASDLAANPTAKARFLREARAQAAIEHDHVVVIHQVGEDRGIPYIAMPVLRGLTLSTALRQDPRPPLAEVVRVGRQIAEGLAAAHARHLVHRDIKPGNIWLEGERRRVKILDFGLARAVADADAAALATADEPVTRQGAVVGTPAYMSPEQARGENLDARTDLFSLGCVLYQMAAGKLPFHGPSTMAVLLAVTVEKPVPIRDKNPAVPPALAELIHRLLEKRANDRPASAQTVADELRQIEQQYRAPSGPLPVVVYAPPAAPEPNPFELTTEASRELPKVPPAAAPVFAKPRRKPWILIGGVAALGVLAAVAAQVVIKVKAPDGTETEIKAPAGSTVTVQDKGKVVAVVGPKGVEVPPAGKAQPVMGTAGDLDGKVAAMLAQYAYTFDVDTGDGKRLVIKKDVPMKVNCFSRRR